MARKSTSRRAAPSTTPKLLTGGNPQIAKGDGDGPVQEYLAAMPGWKSALGRRLDALIVRAVPEVRKAVRWNGPFYGIEGRGWFVSLYCFTNYVKISFLNGSSLKPPPPLRAKHEAVRYLHLHEDDAVDEDQLERWMRQAAKLPGEELF